MGGALWYGWGTYGLNGWGSYDKVSCCFVWKYAQKIAGLQGSTLSDHRMTTGFGPFGFLDFKVDFWISKWISRVISGFQVNFWISKRISGFQSGFLEGFLDFKRISGFQSGFLDFIRTAIILRYS